MARTHVKYRVLAEGDVVMDHTSYEGTHVYMVELVPTSVTPHKKCDSAANIVHRAKKKNAPIMFIRGAVYDYELYELISEAHSAGLAVHIITDGLVPLKFCDGEWIEQPDMVHLLMPTMHCHPKMLMLAGEVIFHCSSSKEVEGRLNAIASVLVKHKIEHHFVGVPVLIAPDLGVHWEDAIMDSLKRAVIELITPWGSGLRLVGYAGEEGVIKMP
jgi:hypothetical protein